MWSDEDLEHVLDGVSRLGWLVIKRFSAIYTPSDVLAAFACLDRSEFDLLRRLHFGLCDETQAFLYEHVPTFLRSAPSATEHITIHQRGEPRGRIDWKQTYAKRVLSGNDPSHFVSRPIERTADSAPARLFAFLLKKLVDNGEWLSKRQVPQAAARQIENDTVAAGRALAALKGRGVKTPSRFNNRDVAPLRKSRRNDVTSAVSLFDIYTNVVELANENLLRNLMRQKQMAPENMDDLFEVWALLTFVELHMKQGWNLEEALLIGGDSKPKRPRFILSKENRKAEIYYQTVPSILAKGSIYKDIFSDYSLDATLRRPDITVQLSGEEPGQIMIVEVKRTQDQSYILDSVYKTLGYIADFKANIGPDSPFAVLVVWGGIERTRMGNSAHPILITNATEFENMLLPY